MNGPGTRRLRAISLMSGGLDSRLAVCVLREQGVEVHGVVFDSPFFSIEPAMAASAQLGIPLRVLDFTSDIVALLQGPKHGFGRCMNPCIDCHARMLTRAGDLMVETGFDFLSTGEVLNERPMSQNRRSLAVVARDSGYGDLVVRPLSAGLLPATKPEREGWIDRTRLLKLEGRGRKAQIRMAEAYGLTDYPAPAGGCLLTEPNFCRRLSDLQQHEGLNEVAALVLLRYGRHFRLDDGLKLIIGRNEADNAAIERLTALGDLLLRTEGVKGPTGLLPCTATKEQIGLAASICARYSDAGGCGTLQVGIRSASGVEWMCVVPAAAAVIDRYRI